MSSRILLVERERRTICIKIIRYKHVTATDLEGFFKKEMSALSKYTSTRDDPLVSGDTSGSFFSAVFTHHSIASAVFLHLLKLKRNFSNEGIFSFSFYDGKYLSSDGIVLNWYGWSDAKTEYLVKSIEVKYCINRYVVNLPGEVIDVATIDKRFRFDSSGTSPKKDIFASTEELDKENKPNDDCSALAAAVKTSEGAPTKSATVQLKKHTAENSIEKKEAEASEKIAARNFIEYVAMEELENLEKDDLAIVYTEEFNAFWQQKGQFARNTPLTIFLTFYKRSMSETD